MAWSMKRTFDLWDEIEAESGQAITSHKVGGIMVARTEDRMDELHRLLGIGRRIGVTYQMLTPDELKAHWPMLDTSSVLGALYDPNGGHVDPYGLTHAYARAARARGAEIRQQCPVTGLRPQPDGSWIVETPQGEIQAGVIINAAGMYADEIAQLTGARLPMTNMAHHYLISEPIKEMQTLDFEPPELRDVDSGV
jgi:dimethylglycine dehydrogenase